TYAGGGWWWLLAVALVALAAATAGGLALGRVAPLWGAAPVAMIGLYALQVYAHDTFGPRGLRWLGPLLAVYGGWGHALSGWIPLRQAARFGGGAGAALARAAARRRWLAILPGAVAVVGAAPFLGGAPGHGWQPDPVATELVCTE